MLRAGTAAPQPRQGDFQRRDRPYYDATVIELDALVNKTVPFKFNGAELRFDLSHGLFSSFDVDVGTRLLLKTVARDPRLAAARKVLDAGCGVGIIGLAAAKAFPEAELSLRDRDSLAVAFSERNRLANKLRGVSAHSDPLTGDRREARPAPRIGWGLLADGADGGPYDYILSNLPAKAGAPVLKAFFAAAGDGSHSLLAPGGRLAVVIVHTLAEAAEGWIDAAGLVVVDRARGSMHRAYVLETEGRDSAASPAKGWLPHGQGPEFPLEGLDLRPYARTEGRFELGRARYSARGFWGLPEFDTPSFGSVAAAELCERVLTGSLVREILLINPGVGHLALWALKRLGATGFSAASRDLLSLGACAANLAVSGAESYRAFDALRLDELPPFSRDLVIDSPESIPGFDWVGLCWKTAAHLVKSGGTYLVASRPTELVRMDKARPSGWSLLGERRKRGAAALAWRRN